MKYSIIYVQFCILQKIKYNGFLCPENQYIIPGLIIPGTEFVDIYRGFDMIEKLSRELWNNSFEDIQFFPTKVELFLTAKAKK